jgi:hypothetical protein
MKSTRIIIKDDEQFEQLDAVRERHGVNWRGMLIKGAERLEAGGVLPTEAELCDDEEVE